MAYQIGDQCVGCGTCAKKCPEQAITGERKVRFNIDPSLCQECGTCFDLCPKGAILDPEGNRPTKVKGKKQKIKKAHINTELCAFCKNCFMNCPQEAIRTVKRGLFSIGYCQVDSSKCIGCGACTEFCITHAVELR
ncbi:MAG: 4Fe-4S binding protein [Deltaproteobacteria bacterium]|nr:4Fe-4S binding protein [Deltaproteobacteria bacterium]